VNAPLRVIVADDERPARAFLVGLLRRCHDTELVGEAADGPAAVKLIDAQRPDLAFLDLQMPEVDGFGVLGMLDHASIPLIAFVTAHDQYAVKAFELNVIDYLLKPVDPQRLRRTLDRAHERLELLDGERGEKDNAPGADDAAPRYLRRIPIRQREDILLLPVEQLASIVARGELLQLTTITNQHFTLAHRLHDLERRLDPTQFIRLSRSAIANLALIQRVSPMPGGTYLVTLSSGHQLAVSRLRARALRSHLLRL
jgi:two-component system, LytTR family, response regulator